MKHAAPLWVLLVLTAAVAAADGPTVTVEPAPSWPTRLAAPVWLTVRGGQGELDLSLDDDAWHVRDRIVLTGAPEETVETYGFARHGVTASWRLAGASGSEPLRFSLRGEADSILCVDGALYRDLLTAPESPGRPRWNVATVAADRLPSRWQAYAGLSAVLAMDGRAARSLGREQREALRLWLTWLGGRLWLLDPDGAALIRDWGWRPLGPLPGRIPGVRLGTGEVLLDPAPDPETILERPFVPERDLLDCLGVRDFSGLRRMPAKDLGGASTAVIVACLVAIGLVLGPLNYFLVKERGALLLFYLITPLAAAAGSAVIVLGTLLAEGGARANELTVLYHNRADDGALVASFYDVRSGVFPPAVAYPPETLIITERRWRDGPVTLDIAHGVRPTAGLLRPRHSTFFAAVRPITARTAVTVRHGPDGLTVENGLGHALEWVVVADGDEPRGWAAAVPAGESARLESSRPPEDIVREWERLPGREEWTDGLDSVAARTARIPYADDGGLGARRRALTYYYMGVQPAAGEGGR